MSEGFDDAMGESADRRMRNHRKPPRAKRTPWKKRAEAWKALAQARGVALAMMSPSALITDRERIAMDLLRDLGENL